MTHIDSKKQPKQPKFDWGQVIKQGFKSVTGWQKVVFTTMIIALGTWVITYIRDHISSPADVAKINAVQVAIRDKITKDSLVALNIEAKLVSLNLNQSLTDQKVSLIQENVKSQGELLIKVLFVMNEVKKSVDYNKAYTVK
ncbi:MAG: hypothetical protein V4549_07460 [Bacteroidota bacterium]